MAGESSNPEYEALEDRALGKAERGGLRGGGRGRGRGEQGREVLISKALSKLLRHQAEQANIQLDGEGYAPLEKVLAWGPLKSQQATFADIQSAVVSSDKQRFSMKPNPTTNPSLSETSTDPKDYLIRANQGHSIKLESDAHLAAITLEEGNVPPRVLHGTYYYFWPKIVESGGLKVMGRNHIHCSTGTPEEGVVSGMRKDAQLVIEIDVESSLHEGIKWWKSDNGVLLTEGDENGVLSSRFLKLVTGRQRDVGTLWENGEWVADLPSGLKVTAPPGKGRGGGRGGRGGRRVG